MAQLFSTIFKTTIYEIYFVHRSCYSCDRLAIGRFCIQCKGPDTHIAGIGYYIITAGSYTQVLIRACFTAQKKSCIIDAALKYLYWVIKQFFLCHSKHTLLQIYKADRLFYYSIFRGGWHIRHLRIECAYKVYLHVGVFICQEGGQFPTYTIR
jgi:hypothetical protein